MKRKLSTGKWSIKKYINLPKGTDSLRKGRKR